MALKFYWANDLTGGGVGALDKIPTANWLDKYGALVVKSNYLYAYECDDDLGGTESSPWLIKPDDESGNKRLNLLGAVFGDVKTKLAKLYDTDQSNLLSLKWNEGSAADYILNLAVGGASRTLALNENFTIGDGTNITITGVTAARTITLNENLTIGNGTDITITGITAARTFTMNENFTIGDGYNGTLTFSADAKTLTVEDTAVVSQDYSSDSTTVSLARLALTGNLTLAANSITGTSVDISNVEMQQLSNIGAATISSTQWEYLGSSTAAGGAILDAATDAAILALLSGDAGAAFDFNAQNLTGVGTIGCGTITTTGNLVLPANGVVGVTDGNPQIVFDNANNWLEITGRIGMGTADPVSLLHLSPASGASELKIQTADTNDPTIRFRTTNTPNQVKLFLDEGSTSDVFKIAGETAGVATYIDFIAVSGQELVFRYYGGTGATYFRKQVDNDFRIDANTQNASMIFEVDVGGTDIDILKLDGTTGRIGVRVANPLAQFHIDQPSTTAAIPVLTLDQADIDLEFIKLIGSSEDGEADRSLVDVADMTTPGALVGWFQVYIEDIQGTNPITDGVYYVPFYAAPSA